MWWLLRSVSGWVYPVPRGVLENGALHGTHGTLIAANFSTVYWLAFVYHDVRNILGLTFPNSMRNSVARRPGRLVQECLRGFSSASRRTRLSLIIN